MQFADDESSGSVCSTPKIHKAEAVCTVPQYNSPPPTPQVLVLSNEMFESFKAPDKYLSVYSMVGYDLLQYTLDIQEGLIDVSMFPYIIVFLSTMQLERLESRVVNKEITDFVETVASVNAAALVIISGLVPRPMDWPRSKLKTENLSRAYQKVVEGLQKKGLNVQFISVFQQFLSSEGVLTNVHANFIEQLYLSPQGIRIIRAHWLRYLGFFPPKGN